MSEAAPTVRFAPSPTGLIHLGNARTALLNWLFARERGGRFVLRLDDTDQERSTDAFAEAIRRDVAWLGIRPDAVLRQSDRADSHRAAAARLVAAGRLYPCYETAAELDEARRLRRLAHLPPLYGRGALALTEADRHRLEGEGRRPHWRLLLPNFRDDPRHVEPTPVVWQDLVRGTQSIDIGSLSDPVLIREDGAFPYTLTSVVDDVDLAITHVIRGEDHVANTAVQIALFRALGAEPPAFGHHNLVADADGAPLSKRSGALAIAHLRAAGYEPEAVAALAVLAGSAAPVEPVARVEDLEGRVALARLSRAPVKLGEGDVAELNARVVAALPYAVAAPRLAAVGADLGPAFWEAVRGNLRQIGEAADWAERVRGLGRGHAAVLALDEADRGFLATAAALLPPEPWDETTFRAWTAAVTAATGRRGKALFRPLRIAATGREDGPELARLMPLIGREGMSARLS